MKLPSEYQKEWRTNKLKEDPDYFIRANRKYRARYPDHDKNSHDRKSKIGWSVIYAQRKKRRIELQANQPKV